MGVPHEHTAAGICSPGIRVAQGTGLPSWTRGDVTQKRRAPALGEGPHEALPSAKGLKLRPDWLIPAQDLEFHYARSSGPGGQNVNKVSSKVELRLLLAQTHALTSAQKRRLLARFPSHTTAEGHFLLSGDRHRSRAQNQRDVLERLARMLESIEHAPPPRIETRPTRASRERRLDQKRRRAAVKRQRRTAD